MFRGHFLPVLAATIWISASEFFRNELWLKHYWVEHYAGLGLKFPSAPINGMVWGCWSLAFAIAIAALLSRFSLLRATALAWFMGFVLMWLVIGNLGVLPYAILVYAAPLSLIETAVAAWIIDRISPKSGD
jgi:hypothetical protein